jgi:hypothetical protein
MKKATLSTLLGIFCLLAGCKKNAQPQPAATSSTPPVVQAAAPATDATPTPPVAPKLILVRPDDSELTDLRAEIYHAKWSREGQAPSEDFVKKYSVEYVSTLNERQRKISEKLGAITDAGLRQSLESKARKELPTVSLQPYVAGALQAYDKKKEDFIARHKNDFILVASYKMYVPALQKAVFNLCISKTSCREYSENLYPFGEPYDSAFLEEKTKISDEVDWGEGYVKDGDYLIKDAFGLPEFPDSLQFHSYEAKTALVVTLSPAEMDGVYQAANTLWSNEIARIEPNCISGNCGKKEVVRYVRRHAIWLAAKGDPFTDKWSEFYLLVDRADEVAKRFR